LPDSPGAEVLRKVAHAALTEHVPAEHRGRDPQGLRQVADDVAIEVFAANVQKVLLSPPFRCAHRPRRRSGHSHRLQGGVVEAAGGYVKSTVFKLKSDQARAAAKEELLGLLREHAVQAVAVGNGTGSREAESFVRASLGESDSRDVPVALVSEAGASVYSASDVARAEFPTSTSPCAVRSRSRAASRIRSPSSSRSTRSRSASVSTSTTFRRSLKRRLDQVVESCVNHVGVELNTALAAAALTHVWGIGEALRPAIVEAARRKGRLFRWPPGSSSTCARFAAERRSSSAAGLPAHPGRRAPAQTRRPRWRYQQTPGNRDTASCLLEQVRLGRRQAESVSCVAATATSATSNKLGSGDLRDEVGPPSHFDDRLRSPSSRNSVARPTRGVP
jgi:hypothetical protein